MKILHLDPDDMESPASGGGPIRTFEIYRRLASKHEITVLTPSFPGAGEKIKEGIRYRRLGGRWRNHNSTYFISFYFAAPFAARDYQYDLLVEDLMPPTAATITPLLNKGPIIASVQWFFAKEWAKQYKLPFHWYGPVGLKFYKNFIVLTEDMKKKMLQHNPKADVRIIPNGPSDELFETTPSDEGFILYMGRIENGQKGVDLLMQAFSKIALKTKAKLVVAGDGVDMEAVRAQVRELGIEERVVFEGRVGKERRKELYSKCRFVAIPSRYEALSLVVLEAFACAKAVVTFDLPCFDIVKKELGLKAPAFDVEAYANAMLNLLEDEKKPLQMGNAARNFALTQTWDRMAEAQNAYYEEVLARSKSS